MHCYSCNSKLTDKNRSKEHVVPNHLGGSLTSFKLLCKECNNNLGEELDSALSKEVFYGNLLPIKRDRPGGRKIIAKTEGDNIELLVDKKGVYYFKPQVLKNKNNEVTGIIGKDFDHIKSFAKAYEKEDPSFDSESFIKKAKYKEMGHKNYRINFSGHLFGSTLAYRAIGKIALNFSLVKNIHLVQLEKLKDFVLGKSSENLVRFFYPLNEPFSAEKSEFSHIVHLKGNKNFQLLYVYVELFNVSKFIVIIDDTYRGDNISHTYALNVLKR